MRRLSAISLVILSGFLPTRAGLICPAFATTKATVLQSVRLYPALEGDTLEIRASGWFDFVTYTLTGPDRLIIDPVEPVVVEHLPAGRPLEGGLVTSWEARPPAGKTRTRQVDYLIFRLTEPALHRVEQAQPGVLTVLLRSKTHPAQIALAEGPDVSAGLESNDEPVLLPATGKEGPPAVAPLPPRPPPPPQGGREGPRGAMGSVVWNLDQALEFGLARHRPIRVAQKEVKLAQMKVREARRALYPAATLRASWTEGTSADVDFREFQTGLQVEHPLYYSGRLMETYRQSLVNLQVSNKRRAKVESDYGLEVAESYFQLIGAKVGLAAQEGLVEEAEAFFKDVQARFDAKLLTRLEVLNVESQVNQARFQQANARNDVTLARIKFLQKLGLKPEAVVEVPDAFPPVSVEAVDLEEAMELAARHRPDIQVNTLLVKFHEYEERIAKAKGKLKVDLSGFAGASASAFETEPLDAAEDYFVGIKATRVWGGNSSNVSITDTKTSPRLGQTTRTDSLVYSAEIGILDQLEGLSEIQQAAVNLEKARRDLEEVKSSVFQQVQEAVVSFEKARLQLQYAEQKIIFRKEQVKILKAQASLNEALPSQVLEAVMKLTEERVGKAQALTNYHTALAKLNKAIGVPNHYR